jgi:hypothetical protein
VADAEEAVDHRVVVTDRLVRVFVRRAQGAGR